MTSPSLSPLGKTVPSPAVTSVSPGLEVGVLGRVVEDQPAGTVGPGQGRDPRPEVEHGDAGVGGEQGLDQRLVRAAGDDLAADYAVWRDDGAPGRDAVPAPRLMTSQCSNVERSRLMTGARISVRLTDGSAPAASEADSRRAFSTDS